jgi:hypothetical protein
MSITTKKNPQKLWGIWKYYNNPKMKAREAKEKATIITNKERW